jgi:hypothetical protein
MVTIVGPPRPGAATVDSDDAVAGFEREPWAS